MKRLTDSDLLGVGMCLAKFESAAREAGKPWRSRVAMASREEAATIARRELLNEIRRVCGMATETGPNVDEEIAG